MMAAGNPPEILDSFKLPFNGNARTTDPLVWSSLSSTVPFAIPGTVDMLEKSRSAPSSPVRIEKKRKGLRHYLPRPKSPGNRRKHSSSDPERTPSPGPKKTNSPRPKWLHIKKKHHRNKSEDMNGDLGSGVDDELTRTLEPEATPVEQLPGRIMKSSSGSIIPVITVSHSGEEGPHCSVSVSLEDINGDGRDVRKMSQSSHCSSTLQSVGTSGVGSLLSPSGDESYIGDDLESPISPLSSRTSSFTENHAADLSDVESIDLISPLSDQDSLSATTPVSTHGSPPPEFGLISPSEMPTCVSPTEGRSNPKPKRKTKERTTKSPWDNLKKAVKAWSPFAVQFKKKCYPWVQLAGHKGNFMPGDENGTIMKKSDTNENNALQKLMSDELRPFVPEFKKVVEKDGNLYVEMTDLLREFDEPAVMDIKVGTRTYLEVELKKKDLRPDMYTKMIDVDPNEPTEAEHAQKAITKPRYMQWRESLSSSSNLGFRVEGIKTSAGKAIKDFKETRSEDAVVKVLRLFVAENPSVKDLFLRKLLTVKAGLEQSQFFKTHELVGSSLLFVYDNTSLCSIHMIDFGKTVPLPDGVILDHHSQWVEGNHEDGYLFGLENLINLWKQL